MILRLTLCSFFFACLCSCASGISSAAPVSPTIFIGTTAVPAVSSSTPTLVSTATPTPTGVLYNRPQYRIRAALDIPAAPAADGGMLTLTVHEQASFSNRFRDPLQELILQFEPSRRSDLFQLLGFTCDRSSQENPPTVHDGQLHIPMKEPLPPGESVSLSLDYRREVAKENGVIGWNDYQIVLGDWYAFFPLYREGTGWLAYLPGKVGEYLTYPYADYDVQLEVTGGSGYQIAASGIPDADSSPWHFNFTGRSFAVALTKQTLFRRTSGSVEVLAYAKAEYAAQGNSVAETAARALTLYSGRFGEYPRGRLTVLESELPDGMEFDGLVFLSPALFPQYTGDAKDYLTAITAHETAHQWWYGRVGNDQAMSPWLDEAFATYSELLFYEKYYPSLADWWWWIRVNRYPSEECVDRSIYDFTAFRPYVDAVYLRGVILLHALRLRMGDPAFWDSLREIQTARLGNWNMAEYVFAVFQTHSNQPLSDIWNQYLCHPPSS